MFAIGGWELLIIFVIGIIMLSILGAVVFVVMKSSNRGSTSASSNDERIRCPECAERIMAEAVKCRFCGARLDPKRGNHE